MKQREALLTHDTLTRLLDYNPETGVFVWKICSAKWRSPGDVAGCNSKGYIKIVLNQVPFMAHRLAWFYVHKVWPSEELDHINLNRSDNRLVNLREASHSANMRNVKMRKHNSVGFKGVIRRGKKYVARIILNEKMIWLGTFDTPEEAHTAYTTASPQHHGEYGRAT